MCLCLLILAGTAPPALATQEPGAPADTVAALSEPLDTATLHATLAEWGDRSWLLLADRGAATGAVEDARGLLLRFHPDFDAEFTLDHISTPFTLLDDYTWSRRGNGARYWSGSINHLLVTDATDIKVQGNLMGRWGFRLRYSGATNPALRRALVRPELTWSWGDDGTPGRGYRAYLGTTLQARKPDRDMYGGVAWSGERGRLDASVHLLDAFSDFIFQGLGVSRAFTDTELDYLTRPWGLRLSGEARLAPSTRFELEGGLLLGGRFQRVEKENPTRGFDQGDAFHQIGALLEHGFTPRVRGGLQATRLRARQDREALAGTSPALDNTFRLEETTTRVGGFLLADLAPRIRAQAWAGREWREELRSGTPDPADGVDYLDRSWWGMVQVDYRLGRIYNAALGWEMDFRDVVRDPGAVPALEDLEQDNHRIRIDLGWRVSNRFRVDLGFRVDADGDRRYDRSPFDGSHGRFVIFW